MRLSCLVIVLLAGALAGCATSAGAWDENGFNQKAYGWTAQYPKGQAELLDANWRLDNWERTEDGSWAEKTSDKYMVKVGQDEDRDGKISSGERHTVPLYDLKFTSATDNGVVWVQTRAVLEWDAQKDLDVLIENYADSLAGTGLYEQGTVFGTATAKARSFTTFVKDKHELKIGPHEGLSAIIEVAESDRLRADPTWRSAKIRLAITKFKYRFEKTPATTNDSGNSIPAVYEDRTAVMLIGYFNDAQRFDAGLPVFDAVVSRLHWPEPMFWRPSKPPKTAPAEPPPSSTPRDAPAGDAPPAEQ
jgi:hypothetical protein